LGLGAAALKSCAGIRGATATIPGATSATIPGASSCSDAPPAAASCVGAPPAAASYSGVTGAAGGGPGRGAGRAGAVRFEVHFVARTASSGGQHHLLPRWHPQVCRGHCSSGAARAPISSTDRALSIIASQCCSDSMAADANDASAESLRRQWDDALSVLDVLANMPSCF